MIPIRKMNLWRLKEKINSVSLNFSIGKINCGIVQGAIVAPPPLIDVDSLFDVQVKRIHEYKRQLMNALISHHALSRSIASIPILTSSAPRLLEGKLQQVMRLPKISSA